MLKKQKSFFVSGQAYVFLYFIRFYAFKTGKLTCSMQFSGKNLF